MSTPAICARAARATGFFLGARTVASGCGSFPARVPARFACCAPSSSAKKSSAPTSAQDQSTARGWRKYADKFRSAPASHVLSFAILHELTAVLPLPVIYLLLHALDPPLPSFSEKTMADAERRGRKILSAFGFKGLDTPAGGEASFGGESARVASKNILHATGAYALVKLAMPVRIAACFALTPLFARVCVIPVTKTTAAARSLFSRRGGL